jgi:hypothetical protein
MFHRALRFVIAYATGGIPYRPVFSDHGMSTLGQKRTFAVHQLMSALPPIATLIAFFGVSAMGHGDLRERFADGHDNVGSSDDRAGPKPAITLSRKDWLFRATRALV